MSADNGIYIHKFSDGWRVCHGQAIENICWQADKSGYNSRVLWDYFKQSPLYKTKIKALVAAAEKAEGYTILENGISFV